MKEHLPEIQEPTRREFFPQLAKSVLAITLATSCKAEKTSKTKPKEEKKYIPSRKLIFEEPENKEALNSGRVIVLFSANYCGACVRAEEFLTQQKSLIVQKGVKPYEFFNDLGSWPHRTWTPLAEELLKTYQVKGLPTIIFLSDGKLIKKLQGIDEVRKIKEHLNLK